MVSKSSCSQPRKVSHIRSAVAYSGVSSMNIGLKVIASLVVPTVKLTFSSAADGLAS